MNNYHEWVEFASYYRCTKCGCYKSIHNATEYHYWGSDGYLLNEPEKEPNCDEEIIRAVLE
jgi:hypothetical protein